MKSPLLGAAALLLLCVLQPAAAQQFVFTPQFPMGVDWNNATPDQISEAVYRAVQENPDQAVEIVTAAIEMSKGTGRFPSIASSDGKQYVGDPENLVRDGSIEDVAMRIGDAAKSANPALAPQIDAAVVGLVPTVTMLSPTSGGGTGSGGGTTGGPGVPLPGGFGGGGGGGTTTNPNTDSN